MGNKFLTLSGASDNKISVALGLDMYLNYTGTFRCICPRLALAVNDAVHDGDFKSKVLEHINSIRKFVKYPPKLHSSWSSCSAANLAEIE